PLHDKPTGPGFVRVAHIHGHVKSGVIQRADDELLPRPSLGHLPPDSTQLLEVLPLPAEDVALDSASLDRQIESHAVTGVRLDTDGIGEEQPADWSWVGGDTDALRSLTEHVMTGVRTDVLRVQRHLTDRVAGSRRSGLPRNRFTIRAIESHRGFRAVQGPGQF